MTNFDDTAGLASADPTRPPLRKGALIAVAALMVTLTNAIIFVMPPLLPVIGAQFSLATVAESTWLYTALTLGGGAGYILLPRLADLFGDRNASVAASGFLAVGALVPAVGNSYVTILVGCILMGFGSAAQLLPLGFLRRSLGASGITIGVGVLVIATGAGIVVGMIGGGIIVEDMSLRTFFVVLAAVCAISTVVCWFVIPHLPPADRSGSMGITGAVWMIAWVAAILLAMTQGLVWGAWALIPLVLGIVGGIAWFRVERRSSSAVFDVLLMKASKVVTACVAITLFAAMNACFLILLTTYAQTVPNQLVDTDSYGLGLSALQTGLLMLPFAATFLVGGVVVDRPVTNGRGLSVLVIGAVITAGGLVWLAFAHQSQWQYLVGAAVVGLGCSIGYAAGFAVVQRAAPESEAGMAAGVAGTFMAVGFALGTAMISADLGAEQVSDIATGLAVPVPGLFGVGYWAASVLAVVVVAAVLASGARSRRRAVA